MKTPRYASVIRFDQTGVCSRLVSVPQQAPARLARLTDTVAPDEPTATRRIPRLDSRTVSLFVRVVIALRHRHRLMAGEVVELLYGDAEVEHSCDEGMAQVVGAYMAEAGAVAR